MVTRWTKGLLHLLVGGACAALVAWLVFGFSQTVIHTSGPTQVAMVGLVLATGLLVAWLLLAPPVRPAEIALARALLDVDLPEPLDTTSWGARGRGLVWAGAVIVLGGLSLLALLWCLPQGIALVVVAFGDVTVGLLPAGVAGLPAALLVLLGLLVAVAGLLVQPVLVAALRALAPRALGPTARDRLAHAERQRRAMLRANELARELHDSVGHALTAIGVQAEAGARVAAADPAYAREALEQISATTQAAVAELDEVLGALRHPHPHPPPSSTERAVLRETTPTERTVLRETTPTERTVLREAGPAGAPPLGALLAPFGPAGTETIQLDLDGAVDARAGHTAYRVVQEALSNARRHGSGDPTGHVRVMDGRVEVWLENRVAAGQDTRGGGRGLVGMRERLALAGGTLQAGIETVDGERRWRLLARLPARAERS